MKKPRITIKSPRILLVVITAIIAIITPLQAFANNPLIITQDLPDAVSGFFYCVQLPAAGLGKNAVWRAEGLPNGIEIDSSSGMIFGTAKNPGYFEILVTVKSGWSWWPKIDSQLFRLKVLPSLPEEVSGQPDTDAIITPAPQLPGPDSPIPQAPTEPQSSTENFVAAVIPETLANNIEWLKLEANGESGVETTTVLSLEFSQELPLDEADYEDYISIQGNAAEIISFSKHVGGSGCTIYLGIANIDPSLKDGDEIEVNIGYVEYLSIIYGVTLDKTSMAVGLKIAAPEPSDQEKVLLAHGELTPESLLGENTDVDTITKDLVLPISNPAYNCDISWRSSDSAYIIDSGAVTRPNHSDGDKKVTLTATITCGAEVAEKAFIVTVKSLAEDPPKNQPENQPEFLPNIAPATPDTGSSKSEGNSASKDTSVPAQPRTSSNVDNGGAISRTAVMNELETASKASKGSFAVIKAKNAQNISPKTLKALADAAESKGMQAVLYADTVTQSGKVDARLYIKPASLTGIVEPLKLGIATKGTRPEKTKKFFEKYFNNEVSVISCEQPGGFGAKLQIAAKVKLPEDIGNLIFYSYDANSNTFTRIFTAYRIDANGYLRFATEKAGDIVVSNGILEKRAYSK